MRLGEHQRAAGSCPHPRAAAPRRARPAPRARRSSCDRGLDGGRDLAGRPRSKQLLDDADAEALDAAAAVGARAGDRVEQERAVLGGARDRADRVERPGDRDDAGVRDEPDRRPQPGDAAEAGGDPDRAGRVGAERAGRELGGGGGAAAAARAAADAVGRPRVAGRAEVRARRQRAVRELVRVELAEHDRRRPRAAADDGSASRAGHVVARGSSSAAVVGVPATSITSLTATGTPCRGPARRRLRLGQRLLGRTVMYAFSSRRASIRSRYDSTASRGESSRRRSRSTRGRAHGRSRTLRSIAPRAARASGQDHARGSRAPPRDRRRRLDALARRRGAQEVDAVRLSRSMPIYEYRCTGARSGSRSYLVDLGDAAPPCPECGAEGAKRLFSMFATEWLPSNVAWHKLPSKHDMGGLPDSRRARLSRKHPRTRARPPRSGQREEAVVDDRRRRRERDLRVAQPELDERSRPA